MSAVTSTRRKRPAPIIDRKVGRRRKTAKLRQLAYVSPDQLKPDPRNPRVHGARQLAALERSIKAFGFNAPILVHNGIVVAGHARLEAAKRLGLKRVPVIELDDLSDDQVQAYMIADNRLTDLSDWDDDALAKMLRELSEKALEFDIQSTGFELPEIDHRIVILDPDVEQGDRADTFEVTGEPPVSRVGDVWTLGPHQIVCGSALDSEIYREAMAGTTAATVITDPPYNVKINGHVSGTGKHEEFPMASGEMSKTEFTTFLGDFLQAAKSVSKRGAVIYAFMDFRHMEELQQAGREVGLELINLCVWCKTQAGMGSFYRSRHELVFVFREAGTTHTNAIQLGRFGRSRDNVWNYAGANVRARKGAENLLDLHATAKPIAIIADAIRDCTKRGETVLDPFLGSGTTILAAERTGRRGVGIELDPRHVDTAIRRWEKMTGKAAIHASGATFAQIKVERSAAAA